MKSIVALTALLIASSAHAQLSFSKRMEKLDLDMDRSEVTEILGKPDGIRRDGDRVILSYTNKLISGFGPDRANYYVALEGGAVVEFGAGEVRQGNGPDAVVVIPVN